MISQREQNNLFNAAKVIEVVKSKNRLRIINYLAEKGPSTPTEIHRALQLNQSHCSTLLKGLRGIAFVVMRQRGRKHYYSVNHSMLRQFFQSIQNISQYKSIKSWET